ncbi:hypothetical protein [Wolbachia endosymbiont of Ctenocephalides felis wCfeT]|uniref:hypothetical protein n=1 Tax=Wolbachia endosymbiont of Ctenocephalides felis wCfeT TaxID=2732593 RepID=UPI0014451AD0|nr:hypothetical protein [Wolbachia endosymbiont of Ctenocephalides felis wCfeT]
MEAKEVKSFSKPTGYCFLSHTPEWILLDNALSNLVQNFECEFREVKANTLKATADNFYENAESLITLAKNEVCTEPASYLF